MFTRSHALAPAAIRWCECLSKPQQSHRDCAHRRTVKNTTLIDVAPLSNSGELKELCSEESLFRAALQRSAAKCWRSHFVRYWHAALTACSHAQGASKPLKLSRRGRRAERAAACPLRPGHLQRGLAAAAGAGAAAQLPPGALALEWLPGKGPRTDAGASCAMALALTCNLWRAHRLTLKTCASLLCRPSAVSARDE